MGAFYTTYSLSLKDTLAIPVIAAHVFQKQGYDVCTPHPQALKAFAERYEHQTGAIRTSLFRALKQQELVHVEERAYTGVGPGLAMRELIQYFLKDPFTAQHFSLILTQLSAVEQKERYRLRDFLLRMGYTKISTGAYLRYGIDSDAIQQALEHQNLSRWIYHFPAIETLPARLVGELESVYSLEHWRSKLTSFEQALDAFLTLPCSHTEDFLDYLFARSSFHKNLMVQVPFLPEAHFPAVKTLRRLYERLGAPAQSRVKQHIEWYKAYFVTPYLDIR